MLGVGYPVDVGRFLRRRLTWIENAKIDSGYGGVRRWRGGGEF